MSPARTKRKLVPNSLIGAFLIAITIAGGVLAFTKELPFQQHYEVKAMFASASNVRLSAPVRIAGINVGEVVGVDHVAGSGVEGEESAPNAALVTMRIDEGARPLKTDATFQLRPRLFLEGNLFVEVRSGSPGAQEAGDGYVFGLEATSTSVQLDEVLTTLQQPVRVELQRTLAELGSALIEHGGGVGLQRFYGSSPPAFRSSAIVAEALLGSAPHELSALIRNTARVMRGLGRSPSELQGLVSNLGTVMGALAANDADLERTIALLPPTIATARPTLASLNAAFPPVRALAIEAVPGVEAAAPALVAATPWTRQLSELVSRPELRGLVADLRPAVPDLTALLLETAPFLEQARALSSCFTEVVVPWSSDTVTDPIEPATGRVYEELGYGLVGVGGESRSHDANGPYIRALAGAGTNTVEFPPSVDRPEEAFGITPYEILGAVPALESSAKTPYRPDVPCETQEPPDLRAVTGAPPTQGTVAGTEDAVLPEPITKLSQLYLQMLDSFAHAETLRKQGREAAAQAAYQDAVREQARLESGPIPRLERQIQALGAGG